MNAQDADHGHAGTDNFTMREPKGWVAWCKCGMGSPVKPTEADALRSLAEHLANPTQFTR